MSWSSFAFLALSKVTPHPPKMAEAITLEAGGFRYQPPGGAAITIRWDDLRRVNAYCVTLFSHEALCVDFEARDGTRVSVNEELPGFEPLWEALPGALGISGETEPRVGEIKQLFERA